MCPCPEPCQHAGTLASLAPATRGWVCIVVAVVRASCAAVISSACHRKREVFKGDTDPNCIVEEIMCLIEVSLTQTCTNE